MFGLIIVGMSHFVGGTLKRGEDTKIVNKFFARFQ